MSISQQKEIARLTVEREASKERIKELEAEVERLKREVAYWSGQKAA